MWLATGHTDMRKGFASLSLQVQEVLRRDPLSGHLFCFRGRRGDLLKERRPQTASVGIMDCAHDFARPSYAMGDTTFLTAAPSRSRLTRAVISSHRYLLRYCFTAAQYRSR